MFTWSELKEIWQFLLPEEQSLVLGYYPQDVTSAMLLYLQGQDQGSVDMLYKVVSREDSTTKLIYRSLIESQYSPPGRCEIGGREIWEWTILEKGGSTCVTRQN